MEDAVKRCSCGAFVMLCRNCKADSSLHRCFQEESRHSLSDSPSLSVLSAIDISQREVKDVNGKMEPSTWLTDPVLKALVGSNLYALSPDHQGDEPSFQAGQVPPASRTAVVRRPLLKKPSLNPEVTSPALHSYPRRWPK